MRTAIGYARSSARVNRKRSSRSELACSRTANVEGCDSPRHAAAWAEAVRAETDAEPVVLEPGGKISL